MRPGRMGPRVDERITNDRMIRAKWDSFLRSGQIRHLPNSSKRFVWWPYPYEVGRVQMMMMVGSERTSPNNNAKLTTSTALLAASIRPFMVNLGFSPFSSCEFIPVNISTRQYFKDVFYQALSPAQRLKQNKRIESHLHLGPQISRPKAQPTHSVQPHWRKSILEASYPTHVNNHKISEKIQIPFPVPHHLEYAQNQANAIVKERARRLSGFARILGHKDFKAVLEISKRYSTADELDAPQSGLP
ncbi:hypothetical protein CPC08DRAFT_754924 [Agrocybe pediades]|nr:hypothetical protein CPC08DRAFT_754924 [Agrocybe pediades]